jgi:enoyl-CoA hydratase/carnithine racemase
MPGTVLYERDGHIATITYNRPQSLNAINGELRADLNATWAQFRDDEEAWVGIVTGAGRAFSAGADLKDGGGPQSGTFWEVPSFNSLEGGMEVWKPVIAAVNGYALGFGLTLVAACDFVIASDRAEFGFPEVRIGVPTRAKEIGLAWKVVPHDQLMDEARALAERLCQSAPLAVRATKEVARRGQELPFVDAIRFGETMRRAAGALDDASEGRTARREQRAPEWRAH